MKNGSAVLDWAVYGGSLPVIELVAAHPEVDKHAKNLAGCSCIMWAASQGELPVCKWLLEQGLDWQIINHHQQGAVAKAAWFGHRAVIEWMVTDPLGPELGWQLDLVDNEGRCAFEIAHCSGHFELGCWMESQRGDAVHAHTIPADESGWEEAALRVGFGVWPPDSQFCPQERKWRKAVLADPPRRKCRSPILGSMGDEQLLELVSKINKLEESEEDCQLRILLGHTRTNLMQLLGQFYSHAGFKFSVGRSLIE